MPEVNRNKNIGEKGVNMNVNTFKKFLAKMNWEDRGVPSFGDLSYLTADQYNASMAQLAASAALWKNGNLKDAQFARGQVPAHMAALIAALFNNALALETVWWQELCIFCMLAEKPPAAT